MRHSRFFVPAQTDSRSRISLIDVSFCCYSAVMCRKTANISLLFPRTRILKKARSAKADAGSTGCFFAANNSKTAAAGPEAPSRSPPPQAGEGMGGGDASVNQAVELGGVLAGDLVDDFGRQPGELLLDVFRAIPARCRRCAGSPSPTSSSRRRYRRSAWRRSGRTGRSHLHWRRQYSLGLQLHQVAEAVLELEIHAVQRIGEPAGAALAKRHAQASDSARTRRPPSSPR